MSESTEEVKRRLQLRGFSREQVQEMQRLAQAMAVDQMRRGVATTSNFVSTVVTLLSSAVGFVAAFAWNTAIQTWLDYQFPVVGSGLNKVIHEFYYAGTATIFAVVVIAILGFINGRLKGHNLIPTQGG